MSSGDEKTALRERTQEERGGSSAADLVVEPQPEGTEKDLFSVELAKTLKETQEAVLGAVGNELSPVETRSWQRACGIVADFKPVPWFIWRLSNFVLGTSGKTREASDGLVFGLRRLLFAAASDPILGLGEKVNSVKVALEVLPPDVLAAVAVIHAINRRLASRDFERIWRPILDDAILRARIGLDIGLRNEFFGGGRGMLAGFAGRCGLAILIATGDLDQARKALERLATGAEIKQVGLAIYECDPLQVSAMALSAAGCGRDAAFGTVAFSMQRREGKLVEVANDEQKRWLSAFALTEGLRTGNIDSLCEEFKVEFGIAKAEDLAELQEDVRRLQRRGHGWAWLV